MQHGAGHLPLFGVGTKMCGAVSPLPHVMNMLLVPTLRVSVLHRIIFRETFYTLTVIMTLNVAITSSFMQMFPLSMESLISDCDLLVFWNKFLVLCLRPGTTVPIIIMDASSIIFRLCTVFWHSASLPVACVITITHQLILWIALTFVPFIACYPYYKWYIMPEDTVLV